MFAHIDHYCFCHLNLLGVVTTLAGGGSAGGVLSGTVDGTGSAAMLFGPAGVTVSTSGTVYVADYYNNRIRMISPAGTNIARMLLCFCFCFMYNSLLFVSLAYIDHFCGCCYFYLLGVVTRLAGGGSASGVATGSVDGTGSAATFCNPTGVAVSTLGTVYVADYNNHLIRMISPTGTIIAFMQ